MAEEDSKSSGLFLGKGSSKLMLGVLVLNTLALMGVGFIVFMDQKQKDTAENIKKLAVDAIHSDGGVLQGGAQGGGEENDEFDVRFFNVGEFTANLNGKPGASHYIRVNVNLQLGKMLQDEEMKNRSPQIRDTVITLLNSKGLKDLQSRDGRKFLKEEIKIAINSFLETGKVVGVYFSTFVFE